jgi:hypothetical protein
MRRTEPLLKNPPSPIHQRKSKMPSHLSRWFAWYCVLAILLLGAVVKWFRG